MKKKLMITGLIAILISIGLSGCNSSPKHEILGNWWSEEGETTDTFTFYDNGSVYHKYVTILDEEWENYTIVGDQLTIGYIVYKFTISDDDLLLRLTNLSENNTRTYNRQ